MQKEKLLSYIIQNLILVSIIIISSLISNLTSFDQYTPFYEMTLIFFSSITTPKAFSFTRLLMYGVLRDILFAYPIGFSPVLFLSFKSVIDLRNDSTESLTIWVIWLKFALSLIIVLIFQAIIVSIAFKYNFIDWLSVVVQRWYFTSLLYPCFHLCYSIITKFIYKKYYNVAKKS